MSDRATLPVRERELADPVAPLGSSPERGARPTGALKAHPALYFLLVCSLLPGSLAHAAGLPAGGHSLAAVALLATPPPRHAAEAMLEGAPGPLPVAGYREQIFEHAFADLPAGVETFEASVEVNLSFPARRATRTAVRFALRVPHELLTGRTLGGERFHHFALTGRVSRGGHTFEDFRYDFRGSAPEQDGLVLGFTRYLRGGPASFRLWLEDRLSGRVARIEQAIEVPSGAGMPAADDSLSAPAAPLLAGVTAGVLELDEPPPRLLAGAYRFQARCREELDEVSFWLDDRMVATKRSAPWSVEIDLGPSGTARRVRAVGWRDGREVATDQIWVNQVDDHFRVSLDVPSLAVAADESFPAQVRVETPDGRPPEHVELQLDDRLVASFSQPPYVHVVSLGRPGSSVLRAVVHLADGRTAEDAVLLNGSGYGEQVDVGLVELYPLVLDRAGRPLLGLGRESFTVYDDEEPQELVRFDRTGELPITVGLLVDRSGSMKEDLDEVVRAAAEFLDDALRTPADRVVVLSFADRLVLETPPTADSSAARLALATLPAGGGTALHDALVQALNYFEGVPGQDALVLYSDGEDQGSRLPIDEIRKTADRVGVAVYVIGIAQSASGQQGRRTLERIAVDTGGRAFFLERPEQLGAAYAQILEELRSRYLLAYRAPAEARSSALHLVRVEVDRPGVRVRARRGYYP